MSSLQPSSPVEMEPGQLLHDLEQRQDDVLAQLDELDAKISEVLKGLGATMEEDDVLENDAETGDDEIPMAA